MFAMIGSDLSDAIEETTKTALLRLVEDDNGYLEEFDFSRVQIPKRWQRLVDSCVAYCSDAIGAGITSIYLTGSVARGCPADGISDLDMAVVTNQHADPLATADAIAAIQRQVSASGICVRSEVWFIPLEFLIYDDYYSPARFVIKTQGRCVFGKDIRNDLPRIRPGSDVQMTSYEIKNNIENMIRELDCLASPNRVEALCGSACKMILRAGAEMASAFDRMLAIDMYCAFASSARAFPAQEPEFRRALFWVYRPTADVKAVKEFLETFGRKVSDAADKHWRTRSKPFVGIADDTVHASGIESN